MALKSTASKTLISLNVKTSLEFEIVSQRLGIVVFIADFPIFDVVVSEEGEVVADQNVRPWVHQLKDAVMGTVLSVVQQKGEFRSNQ